MPIVINHYRFGNDDALASAHTFINNEDTACATCATFGSPILLRFNEQVVTAVSNVDFQFRFKVNAGALASVSITSSPIQACTSAFSADTDNLTQRLSGTGTFETTAAGFTIDGLSGGNSNDIVLDGCSETELCFKIIAASVVNGDVITFDGSSPDATVTFSVTPTLTVYAPPSGRTIIRDYYGWQWRNN